MRFRFSHRLASPYLSSFCSRGSRAKSRGARQSNSPLGARPRDRALPGKALPWRGSDKVLGTCGAPRERSWRLQLLRVLSHSSRGPGPFPGVIDLFGGSGGLIEFRAILLANRGFAVLALAFFGYDDLPQTLEEVDLEYFEEASTLLLKHPKVRGPGLGVVGLSKGSEIALAMITFLDQIVAAVCINGATGMRGASLRFRDVYIPAIPYAVEKVLITEMGTMSSYHVMEDPLDERHHSSAIPLEKAQGPVLFVVSESDQSLNSKLFAEAAIARAKQHGKRNCALLSYPGAGHLLEPPGSPLCYCSAFRSISLPNQWGGEVELHAKAQEHSWKEIQKFLELHLGPVGKSNF
ncbi:bile acid-CoA:amino acid N-acyltransferase isoform X3 [Podarcis raffonei]|uniref:bile acid-CoA:amino acid N-acyltransferase isoform X3 n=1 Tax=Podarcis raffonei TaxID=65483 RepID=UPI00232932F8|nr:bile acid-CoA:amino acid N-acyltransferase isoform X3 [Podarcis raffonei]